MELQECCVLNVPCHLLIPEMVTGNEAVENPLCSLMLCRLLNTFQSALDEVSIIALPTQHSIAVTGPQGQAAAQRYVRLQSFYDPAKGKELTTRTCPHSVGNLHLHAPCPTLYSVGEIEGPYQPYTHFFGSQRFW